MDLQEIVGRLAVAQADPNLLVGFATADDAGVYRLTEEIALVQTVDFITPIVDDPFTFGQIAAANALSDVYAMGGRPLTAMNICCFPKKGIPPASLARILEGALERVRSSGAVLVGGHSVTDNELKFGLSVTGVVHPARILRNGGGRPGDRLILTKPIGTGMLVGGWRKGKIEQEALDRAARWMVSLNDRACRIALGHGATSATDITGFGLAGHAWEMARAGGVGLVLSHRAVPFYPEAAGLAAQGITTVNNKANKGLVEDGLRFDPSPGEWEEELYFDPQTSGGLLFSLPADAAEDCVRELHQAGDTTAALVGEVVASPAPSIRIVA